MDTASRHESAPDSRLWRSVLFQRWLNRRLPPSHAVTLNQGNIFIMPTRQGIYFLVLVLFMVMAAINYQNSLIFGLAFLLLSLFMVSILHTFSNLSGLNVQAGSARPVFAGEDAGFSVRLSRQGARRHEAIVLGWHTDRLIGADLLDDEVAMVRLYVLSSKRGTLNPGRLLIQTHYPVGLFRAWSWIDLDMSAIIYPRPVVAGDMPTAMGSNPDGELLQRSGVDDFYGLRDYQPGDSLKHMSWKSYARTGQLFVKEFATSVDQRVWIDWDYFPHMDRENRLSRLCYWVVQLGKSNDEYGLRLPGLEIAPDKGAPHQERLLRELALFETEVFETEVFETDVFELAPDADKGNL
jgi:uncharacterized protein (DUF58 family)